MNLFKRNQDAEPEPIELPSLREVSGLVPASAKSPEMKFLRVVEVPPYHYAVVWERVS